MSIYAMYFSPTGNTKKVCCSIATAMVTALSETNGNDEMINYKKKNLTRPQDRRKLPSFEMDDIVIFGMPVYGGRIPQLVLDIIQKIKGNQAKAVAVVTYGVRDYDDALLELSTLLKDQNFHMIGAAAMIGQHSFNVNVGKGRPDTHDVQEAEEFGRELITELYAKNNMRSDLTFDLGLLKGTIPYKEVKPAVVQDLRTADTCTHCGICSNLCPTGAISTIDQSNIDLSLCIRCHACVRNCPVMAKQFVDEGINQAKNWLEQNCMEHKKNEFYI